MGLLLLFTALLSAAAAAPPPAVRPAGSPTALTPITHKLASCNSLIETVPWQLSNIQLFTADNPTPTLNSSINFHFCDQSSGLELDTECGYIFQAGESGTPGPGYEPCADPSIEFTYNDGLIQVERFYEDPW